MPPSSPLILPAPHPSRPLSLDLQQLRASLRPHLPARRARLAVWHLPAHITLPLALAAPHLPAAPVLLNDRWSPADAARTIRVARPHLLLLPASPDRERQRIHHQLVALLPDLPRIALARDARGDIVLTPFQPPLPSPSRALPPPPDDAPPAPTIFFTSGTTSQPKPVILPPSALHIQSLTKISVLSLSASTVYLHLAPLFHLGGFSTSHAVSLVHGTHIFPPSHLHPSRPSHAAALLRLADARSVTLLVLVPSVLQLLVDAGCTHHLALPRVATLLYGGGALSPALRRAAALLCPNARLVGAYGMTETASSLSFLPHTDLPADSPLHASAGWPPPHVQLRLQPPPGDTDDRTTEAQPVIGEVLTRGPHLMHGYDGTDGDTGIANDGWFHTGDLGYINADSGALFLVGRRKDMIKSGGENVFAGEVEEALVSCVEVREAAVVGIPHRVLGEAVAAAVVLMNGVRRPETEIFKQLRDVCHECLSSFKRPKWIVKQASLPRNATGKVLKSKVREQLQLRILAPTAKL